MIYTQVKCLKHYVSPLNRAHVLHFAGRTYEAHKAVAEGFYAVECECYDGQPLQRISIQVTDTDYEWQ
jgi:hypothetical protein